MITTNMNQQIVWCCVTGNTTFNILPKKKINYLAVCELNRSEQ